MDLNQLTPTSGSVILIIIIIIIIIIIMITNPMVRADPHHGWGRRRTQPLLSAYPNV